MRRTRRLAAAFVAVAALCLSPGLTQVSQASPPSRTTETPQASQAPRAAQAPQASQASQAGQASPASSPSARAAQDPVRIMPLGDSITGSPGCWRALLWQDLVAAGHTAVDFVGTLPGQGCGFAYDGENEGHGGILATNMADQNQLPPWLSATNPDVVLMHLGTNDAWSGRPTDTILDAFTTLVTQMRANNPAMEILVAQIIPMDSARSCAECGQRVADLNAAIPGWAASLSTAGSPITVVDQWTGFDTDTDTYDGVHPNDAGNRKLADGWFAPLTEAVTTAATS
ncbi:SGNH/GDSL hydrolase family protein [Streptomyces sp. 4N509B]|uniref:SGNH/GDSL hydrolase family protein n=1 Tax=Streptomyces sp. 4N509B TaxID=3457413 RepID=UPI003FD1B10E